MFRAILTGMTACSRLVLLSAVGDWMCTNRVYSFACRMVTTSLWACDISICIDLDYGEGRRSRFCEFYSKGTTDLGMVC